MSYSKCIPTITNETENTTNIISNLNKPITIVPIKVSKEIFETKMLNKIFLLNEKNFLITTKKYDQISTSSNIIISELSNKNVSIVSDFFALYELEIEKQRYFGSVTYFHNGDSDINLDLEIGETATGLFLSLVYYDNFNNQYVFTGEN